MELLFCMDSFFLVTRLVLFCLNCYPGKGYCSTWRVDGKDYDLMLGTSTLQCGEVQDGAKAKVKYTFMVRFFKQQKNLGSNFPLNRIHLL
jgi:hypothetical protein